MKRGESRDRSKDPKNSVSKAIILKKSRSRSRSTPKKENTQKSEKEMISAESDVKIHDLNSSPDYLPITQSKAETLPSQSPTNRDLDNNFQYPITSAKSDQDFVQPNNSYTLPPPQHLAYSQQANSYGFDPAHQPQKSFSSLYPGFTGMPNSYMPMPQTFPSQPMQPMMYPGYPNTYYPQAPAINSYLPDNNMGMMPYQFPIPEASPTVTGQKVLNNQSVHINSNPKQSITQERLKKPQQFQDVSIASPQSVDFEHADIKNYIEEQEQFLKKLDQNRKNLQEKLNSSNADTDSKVTKKPFSYNQLVKDSNKSDILQKNNINEQKITQEKFGKVEIKTKWDKGEMSEEAEEKEPQRVLDKDLVENEAKLQDLKKKTDQLLERFMKPKINVVDDEEDDDNDGRSDFIKDDKKYSKFSKFEKNQENYDENLLSDSSSEVQFNANSSSKPYNLPFQPNNFINPSLVDEGSYQQGMKFNEVIHIYWFV